MEPSGQSDTAKWSEQTAEFMKSVGMITKVPAAKTCVTDKFLLMLANDPKLKALAESAGD
jgi:NitT/TauT family transport system substrate-binding protein